MATVGANGELQLEEGDVIPRAVAVRDDDPAHIREVIAQINPTIQDDEQLAQAVIHVDNMRVEWRKQQNQPIEESFLTQEEAKALEKEVNK